MNAPPGPMLALCAALATAALATSQPLVLAVLIAGAIGLVLLAPGRRWPAISISLASLVFWTLLNPFVAAQGDLILFAGPDALGPVFDFEVTLEEMAYGAASGTRAAIVILASDLFLRSVDADRLTDMVARVLPRSALLAALAGRMVPTLVRDAAGLADGARARGLTLRGGSWVARARAHATLAAPLLATSLERGLDSAEAMVARGYGAAPRSAFGGPAPARAWRLLFGPAAVLVVSAAALRATGSAALGYYPQIGDALAPSAVLAAAACACGLIVGIGVLGLCRRQS